MSLGYALQSSFRTPSERRVPREAPREMEMARASWGEPRWTRQVGQTCSCNCKCGGDGVRLPSGVPKVRQRDCPTSTTSIVTRDCQHHDSSLEHILQHAALRDSDRVYGKPRQMKISAIISSCATAGADG